VPIYVDRMNSFVSDPWQVRDDYISVILDRSPESVDAFFREIPERVLGVTVKHQATPVSRRTPNAIPRIVPAPAMSTIAGMYRKISFFTPVREVNVVEPVKLRARYATTGGMMRNGTSTAMTCAMPERPGARTNAAANGIATRAPRMKPFREKSLEALRYL